MTAWQRMELIEKDLGEFFREHGVEFDGMKKRVFDLVKDDVPYTISASVKLVAAEVWESSRTDPERIRGTWARLSVEEREKFLAEVEV